MTDRQLLLWWCVVPRALWLTGLLVGIVLASPAPHPIAATVWLVSFIWTVKLYIGDIQQAMGEE